MPLYQTERFDFLEIQFRNPFIIPLPGNFENQDTLTRFG